VTTETGDTVAGGASADTVAGGASSDTLAGASGADTLKGGSADAGTKGEPKPDGNAADDFKPHGAPEAYADPTVPEGMELDKALVEKFAPTLKKLDLSQAGFQELSTFFSEWRKGEAEASTKAWDDTIDTWAKGSKADAEIGGANYDANLGTAKRVLNTFWKTPEEHQAWSDFVDSTGVGEHPVLKRLLVRIGKTIKDDTPIHGGSSQPERKDTASRLFPKAAAGTL
jgi:hypothetical protein